MKKALARALGPERVAKARAIREHIGSALSVARGEEQSLYTPDFAESGLVRLMAQLKAGDLFQALRCVSRDTRYLDLIDSRYFRAQVAPDVHGLLLGAAAYANGDAGRAAAVFAATAEAHPSALAYLCLARAHGSGRFAHAESAAAAEAGLSRFPGDLLLTMAAAVGRYRLKDTAGANRIFAPVKEEFLSRVRAANERLQRELDDAITQDQTYRKSDFGYSSAVIIDYWERLWRYMHVYNPFQAGWSSLRWLQATKLREALKAHPVESFVNFGAFCAQVDSDLAAEFPGVAFHAVDRGADTKRLNEQAFAAPNLTFHDAFINEFLEACPQPAATLLYHARTTTLFYPAFVRQFYKDCARRGIRYIGLWENNSLSHVKGEFYDFGAVPRGSVAYQVEMFIHDYGAMLADAGYSIVVEERCPSNMELIDTPTVFADGHVFLLAELR